MGSDDELSVEELEREAHIEETIDNPTIVGSPESEIGALADGTAYVGLDVVVTLEASREMAGEERVESQPVPEVAVAATATAGTSSRLRPR
ncbi:MAG: hypothetical protein H6712_34300 [Myxococcales bacterium]|nr:hypothetical protein [Myxococcales bacterium]MCB9718967.1 hypothetical protein [Myxococcales bacterium]